MRVRNRLNGKSRGAVLLTVLIVLVFLAALGMSIVAFVHSRVSYAQLQIDRLRALYLAEAGIAKAIYELRIDADADGDGTGNIPATKLGAGTYRVKHDFQTSTITSTGEVNDARRTFQIKYSAI